MDSEALLRAFRAAAVDIRTVLGAHPTTRERAQPVGLGEGGDQTVMIDQAAEAAVFTHLDRLHAAGHRFCAVSEERGVVDYGSSDLRVVIDPIDGSVNAKRGLPFYAVSIAVADGPTVGDVRLGFVYDFGSDEEWAAEHGAGATLDGELLDPGLGERRLPDGRIEALAIELDTRSVGPKLEPLMAATYRVRVLGSMALALCQVAAARVDGMITLRRTRSVDVAAAALIVREGGGLVRFPGLEDPLGAPLDLEPHAPVAAARTEATLDELAAIAAE
ncbi:MAG: inositol monophosphatase [Solirubrobacterales bacterium]|nr:inositol monophosphatase [Solirubrobacterales bacterium]